MGETRKPVTVRSYHGVVDRVERRIFRFERWRLPTPYGIAVRSLVYVAAAFLATALLSALPLLGLVLGALPWALHWLVLPPAAGWALSRWEPDGRAPHFALRSAARFLVAPRRVAALRPCPPTGVALSPVAAIQIASSGDEPRYRPGRVLGPGRVLLRYPARVELERSRRGVRRVRIHPPLRPGRPLPVASVLEVPGGGEVVVRPHRR